MNLTKTFALIMVMAGSLFRCEGEDALLWESCDDLNKGAPGYGQKAWYPDAFKDIVGKLEVHPGEKLEGTGSIHWLVTKQNVNDRQNENPGLGLIMINFLYGQKFEYIIEVRFNIKCKTSKHPQVFAQLVGTKAPSIRILGKNEITDGWKDIIWKLNPVEDIGVSKKYGCIMNYFRIYMNAEDFQDDDILDFYIDNMRLVATEPDDISRSTVAPVVRN